MGFPGLLREMGRGLHVDKAKFKGQRAVIDGYDFVMERAQKFAIPFTISHSIQPIIDELERTIFALLTTFDFVYLVWEGRLLPCKSISVISKRMQRERHL